MKKNFSAELDKNEVNYYELVNVSAQAARMINDQLRIEGKELDHKVTTEALQKIIDGRVVVIRDEETV